MAHVQVYYHPDDSNQAPEQLLRLVAHSIRWIMTLLQFIGHKLGAAAGYDDQKFNWG